MLRLKQKDECEKFDKSRVRRPSDKKNMKNHRRESRREQNK